MSFARQKEIACVIVLLLLECFSYGAMAVEKITQLMLLLFWLCSYTTGSRTAMLTLRQTCRVCGGNDRL